MSLLYWCVWAAMFIPLATGKSAGPRNEAVANVSYPYRVTKEYDIIYPSVLELDSQLNISAIQTSATGNTTALNSENLTSCGLQKAGSDSPKNNTGNASLLRACTVNDSTLQNDNYDARKPRVPTHYSLLFAAVAATLSAVIFIFGILGNVLVVVVIVRTHSMHTTTNCYLLSLAVADSLVLLSGTLPAIPEPFFRVDEWPYGRVMCSLLIFTQYLGVDASSLSITAFTIERYIAICHPMKAQTMCTVTRAKRIIAAIWVFIFLYCSPWLGLTDIFEDRSGSKSDLILKCQFRFARSSYLVLYMIDLILFYVIPLIIATVLYLLIGRILYLSRNLRKVDHPSNRRSPKKPEKRRADSRVQVVRMLVVVVVAFASLWMPYRVMVVYNSFAQHKYMDIWFLLFARTMVYVNCAINPVLYNIMSVKFKRAFRNHLTCWVRRSSVPSHYSEVPTDQWGPKRLASSKHSQLLYNSIDNKRRDHTLHTQLYQHPLPSSGTIRSPRTSPTQQVMNNLNTAEQAV